MYHSDLLKNYHHTTVKIGLKATPNVLRFHKVWPAHRVFGFLKLVNDQDNKKYNENVVPCFYPFCYAFSCLRQFILVVVGFLQSHPLTAHFYVKPAMSLLASGLVASGSVASGSVASSSVLPSWHLPSQWLFSLAVLVDCFGFSGGCLHSLPQLGVRHQVLSWWVWHLRVRWQRVLQQWVWWDW